MKVDTIEIPITVRLNVESSGLVTPTHEALIKAEDIDEIHYGAFVKAIDESRFSLGLAYPALRPDARKGADGKRDVVRPEVLEKAAWTWMRKSASAGLYHFNGAGGGDPVNGCCTVVESYIYRGPDWLIKAADDSEVLIRPGDWLMGALWETAESWDMVKSLQVRGWSPEGGAKRGRPSPYTLAEMRS